MDVSFYWIHLQGVSILGLCEKIRQNKDCELLFGIVLCLCCAAVLPYLDYGKNKVTINQPPAGTDTLRASFLWKDLNREIQDRGKRDVEGFALIWPTLV